MTRDPEDPRSDDDMQALAEADRAWRVEAPEAAPKGNWRALAPTSKQIYTLKQQGFTIPATRGEAAEMLDKYFEKTRTAQPGRRWTTYGP